MTGWRDIASAPRDGTEILLATDNGFMFVAFYDDTPGNRTHVWQTADGVCYHRDLPTHWMPLPLPPTNGDTNE